MTFWPQCQVGSSRPHVQLRRQHTDGCFNCCGLEAPVTSVPAAVARRHAQRGQGQDAGRCQRDR